MARRAKGKIAGSPSADLHVKIAWLYHVEGMTQEAIAQLLDISRIRVMRSLAASAEQRMIVTTINASASEQIALERRLEARWELDGAVVVPTPTNPAHLERSIGHAIGHYINETMVDGMVLAIGGGATLHASLDFLEHRTFAAASVIGLVGALPSSRWINPSIVASSVARRLGAQSYQITAPVVVDVPELREQLWAQPALQDVRARAQAADVAILTVGEMSPDATVFRYGIVPPETLEPLRRQGAVANILGYFVNSDGMLVEHDINRRIMAIPPAEVATLSRVILAAGGPQKVAPILAALPAVRANILVTDVATAEQLL